MYMWSYLCLLIEIANGIHNNPLCIITEALIESNKDFNPVEIQIIKMLHHIDPSLRKTALEVKLVLDNPVKSVGLVYSGSNSKTNSNSIRCRSQNHVI